MKPKTIEIPLLEPGHPPDLSCAHMQKLFPESDENHPLIYVEQLQQATDMAAYGASSAGSSTRSTAPE